MTEQRFIHPTWVDLLTLAYIAFYPDMHPARARLLAERYYGVGS